VPGIVAGPAVCAPDSKSVWYGSNDAIWHVSLDGGTPEKTNLPLAYFGFSPDGRLKFTLRETLAGGIMTNKLVIAGADGGPDLHVFDNPYGMTEPTFTPDSKAIAFLLTRNHATNVWEQPIAGGESFQLTKFTSGGTFAFSWSPDGKQLAFSRGQNKTDVIMMSNFH
jgi:hypothetical protein